MPPQKFDADWHYKSDSYAVNMVRMADAPLHSLTYSGDSLRNLTMSSTGG